MGRGRPLFESQTAKDFLEARNGRLQYRLIESLASQMAGALTLTPAMIKSLHRAAFRTFIYSCAGQYRTWPVQIRGSAHRPPESRFVPGLVDEMCREANSHEEWDAVKVSAYVLWRLSWIHPFGGGNGRTARALAELALRVRINRKLPAIIAMPEQIVGHRREYEDALKDTDEACWI
jgi:Fic family protein